MPNNIVAARQRQAPWIGIGVSGHWNNSYDALQDAGLDFEVRREELFWQHDCNGIVYNETAPMYANVRNTDDMLLGCVTPQYKLIQNRDAFSLIDPFLANGEIIQAGMTEDGLVFMVAEVGMETIRGDDYMIDLMVTNSFNTKYPCQIIMTPLRIICQNMYKGLVKDRIFLTKHTLAANEKIQLIANGNVVEKRVLAFANIVEQAQHRSMTAARLKEVLEILFPYPKEGGPREETFRLKADSQRQMFIDEYYDAPDNRQYQDTAFGFINAYFDYLSHRQASRETSMAWADRRLSGIVSGADINNAAIKAVL